LATAVRGVICRDFPGLHFSAGQPVLLMHPVLVVHPVLLVPLRPPWCAA
jgi:hypothetical protein